MFTLPLDVILGSHELAAAVLNQLTDDMVALDCLDRDRALKQVCERASDSDPLLLAAPGQVWVLRDDVDPDDVPAPSLEVLARIEDTEGPGVLVRYLGGEDSKALWPWQINDGIWPLQITGLASYHLASWDYTPRPARSWPAATADKARRRLATAWYRTRLATRPRVRGVRDFVRNVIRVMARRTPAFDPTTPTA